MLILKVMLRKQKRMETMINKYLITSYVDGQVSQEEKIKIEDALNKDPSLQIDFKIQSLMKELVTKRLCYRKTPERVSKKIILSLINNFTDENGE